MSRDPDVLVRSVEVQPAAAFLSEAFAGRDAKKTYLAIVCGGAPEPRDGEIALALRKSNRRGLDIMEIDTSGQAALTRYHTLGATPSAAFLELSPETGRMHQLRAHCAAIGRPIAGDGKYGGLFNLAGIEIPSLALHAAALDIPHPAGGRKTFVAPPPAAFLQAQRSLGLETAAAPET